MGSLWKSWKVAHTLEHSKEIPHLHDYSQSGPLTVSIKDFALKMRPDHHPHHRILPWSVLQIHNLGMITVPRAVLGYIEESLVTECICFPPVKSGKLPSNM